MKKVLSALLAVAMIGALLAACGGGSSSTPASTPAASTPASSTPASSEAPAATGGFKVASHNAIVEGNPYRTVYEDQMAEAANTAKEAGLISEYNSFVANNDPAPVSYTHLDVYKRQDPLAEPGPQLRPQPPLSAGRFLYQAPVRVQGPHLPRPL